jgi:hypothetical protein
MTPQRPSRIKRQFSNSNYNKLRPRNSSFASQRRATPKPHSLRNTNPELANARQAANEITDNNSNSRHPQCLITSEGGHTSDTASFTFEGDQRLPATLAAQPVAHMAIALGNNHWSQQHQANAVIDPVTGKKMEYSALMKDSRLQPLWTRGFGKEWGRLFQGIRDIPGTDTCFFVELKNIPKERNITYGKIVCDYKPHKQEKERVRLTIRDNRLDYSGDVATSTADITTFKIIINSTLSTKDATMIIMDIKNYYLGTPMPRLNT